MLDEPLVIEKAGGIIVRQRDGGTQMYVIHRQRYDDWTLPKGHVHVDEAPEQAALREVREETGLQCMVLGQLPVLEYEMPDGDRSTVHYFVMAIEDPSVEPLPLHDNETDEGRWISYNNLSLLTYDSTRRYLEAQRAAIESALMQE